MRNALIEASAGTGKTQALGERLIALLQEEVRPQEIVALTFSRAAAGEIFERFVSLLAERAKSSDRAARHLREVLRTQHLSQIGTLDSFLMRIARVFPQELGLFGELTMMDDYEAARRRSSVSFSILRRSEARLKKTFVEAFSLAMNHEDVRSFIESYRSFVKDWHERVLDFADSTAWGDPAAIWGEDKAFAHITSRELAAAADRLEGISDTKAWLGLIDFVRNFRGRWPESGLAKRLLASTDVFAGDVYSFTFANHHYPLTREQTLALREALIAVCGYVVRMKLELARGIYTLISAFETDYNRQVRRTGKLVFADVPRLLKALSPELRLSLEYRLDARIRAWALDEFQDTSRGQWAALANLIDEARQSEGEKSVFIVGDRKQAIYGWREGDVGIFAAERESGLYAIENLEQSHRSGPSVIEAVNRVFARGRILTEFPAWKCPEHTTARPDLTGFVRTIEAPGRSMGDFVEPVFTALVAAVGLKADDPRRRAVSTAVLVRGNSFGELLADELKARGLEGVVWEGERRVLETPALSGFLDLVQLSDHPGDALTYRHFRLTPLAAARYPDGVPPADELSREMSLAFTTRGLVRVFRELRANLPADPQQAWSVYTEECYTEMLRAAAEFESGLAAGTRLADFAEYLRSKSARTVAEAGKIRIMTIHRAKGLGFDYVVLPLYEHDPLKSESKGPLLGDDWVLPDPTFRVAQTVGGLEAAYSRRRDREEQEALCVYYVALTRAKRAMSIVLTPELPSLRFSDLVRSGLLDDLSHPEFSFAAETPSEPTVRPANRLPDVRSRGPRLQISRRMPSEPFATGITAGSLFASAERRQAALLRGTAAHREMENVEFSAELPKPSGFVALWREKSFEVFADGAWISGRFDRVVFARDAEGLLHAEIIDFKTSLRDPERYDGQLTAYRRAVHALTGLPLERVSARLMLVPSAHA